MSGSRGVVPRYVSAVVRGWQLGDSASGMAESYRPCYFETQLARPDGPASDLFEWKTWAYSNGKLMWELRRPLLYLVERRPVKVCSLLKRDFKDWVELCVSLLGEGCITMSARQVAAQPPDDEDDAMGDPMVRQEHTCSTCALFLLFVWAQLHRRKAADRARCFALCAGLFLRLLTVRQQALCMTACPQSSNEMCKREPIVNQVCVCLQTVSRGIAGVAGEPGMQALGALAEMCVFIDCPGVKVWALAQVSSLGAAIDGAVRELRGCSDPLRSRQVLAGPKRNLRVDEDVKVASFNAVREGRAHSVESLQVALGDSRSKGARHWVHERMQVAMAGGWLTGARCGCLSIAADGSRFGNPAEETIAYAWWDASSSTGGWLPVQVAPGPTPPAPPKA